MRKSGLQKQVASIFNDVPMPKTNPASVPLPVQQKAADGMNTNPAQNDSSSAPCPAGTQKKPSLVQRMTATQTGVAHTPAVSSLRPKPLPKTRTAVSKPKSSHGIVPRLKKAMSGSSQGSLDARQKKAAILVGVLSLVFAGVLVVSLGGMGHSSAKAAGQPPLPSGSTAQAEKPKSLQWEKPQPLPAELRNPMSPQAAVRTGQDSNAAQDGQMVVRGIVFTKDNPSAIIDSQIVRQGGILNGITITKITKDSVEFQMGDKRWTQQVQH